MFRAVEEAYHGLLMSGKHPVAVLNVSLPPGDVDVNIHPTKTEVKFSNERMVFTAVQRAVRQTLIELTPVPKINEVVTAYKSPLPPEPASWLLTIGGDSSTDSAAVVSPTPTVSLPALRVLGQLLSSYIIADGPDGLYLIDQHAAHERILLEKVKQQQSRREVDAQGLLEPATFDVNPQQEEVLKVYGEKLAGFGFSIEPFGVRTYLVRTVPVLLHGQDWAGVMRELLDSLSGGNTDDWLEKIAISIACHSAVRAGQVLTDNEMRELIRQLESAAMPHTCPHGRPALIHISAAQLKKEFGRS